MWTRQAYGEGCVLLGPFFADVEAEPWRREVPFCRPQSCWIAERGSHFPAGTDGCLPATSVLVKELLGIASRLVLSFPPLLFLWASPRVFQKKCPQKYQGKKGTFPRAALVTEGANSWQGKEETAGGSDQFPIYVGIRMGMSVCSHCQPGPTAGLQGKPCPCSSATAHTAGRRIRNESLRDFWQRSRACHLSPKRS